MKFFKSSKNLTILFAALFVIFGAVAVITYPKGKPDVEGKYQQVIAKVTDVEGRKVGTTKNNHTVYYVTLEYNNKEYELSTSNGALYTVGMTYNMYLYNDGLYRTVKDMEKGATIDQISTVCTIAMLIAFVSMIAFVTCFGTFIQNKHKKKK